MRADAQAGTVYVLSLPDDQQRRAPLLDQLGRSERRQVELVPGVDGRCLPQIARTILAYDEQWARNSGTIGCFLSHVAAWERIASSGSNYGIVLEDDTLVTSMKAFDDFEMVPDIDVVYINGRYTPSDKVGKTFVSHGEMLHLIEERDCALGNEGYAITAAAARRMLHACAKEGFFGHIDGRMLRYCSCDADIAALPLGSRLKTILTRHHHPSRPVANGICRSLAYGEALVVHRGEPSVRERLDALTRM